MREKIKTTSDAIDAIAGGVVFFLKEYTWKTVLVLAILFGSSLWFVIEHLNEKTYEVFKPKPKMHVEKESDGSGGSVWTLMPQMYAGVEGKLPPNAIVIANEYWGDNDTNYVVYKLMGEDNFLITKKGTAQVFQFKMNGFSEKLFEGEKK